jgi:hypothetical protein
MLRCLQQKPAETLAHVLCVNLGRRNWLGHDMKESSKKV